MKARTTKRRAALLAIALVGIMQAGCGMVSIPTPDKPNEPPPAYKELIRQVLQGRIELPDADNVTRRGVGTDNPNAEELSSASPITIKRFKKEIASELSDFSVSRPELELSHVGWAWKSCLKARYRGSDITIAFFLRPNRVLDARINVAADCVQQEYEAFDADLTGKRKGAG